MSLRDHLLKGGEWDQAEKIRTLTSSVSGGYCRALVIYYLHDCVTNQKVTVASNFSSLIKSHSGNLKAIAQTQENTDRIGSLNALDMTTVHLLQVSKGAVSINTAGGRTWFGGGGAGTAVSTAVANSTTTPQACFVHLEWDGGFFSSSGAHAIGVIREDGGSTFAYTVFDPNYGILRAYSNTLDVLMADIVREYGVGRFMAMPLQ